MITGPYADNLRMELTYLLDDMKKREQDLVISVFGMEGSGKSIWAMNLAVLLDNNFNASTLRQKTAQTINDFGRVAPKTKPFEVCWWDEAHRFSKRGTYDAEENRDLLEYFQDIRGGKKIFILCYPDKEEIDKKVLKRSRLFFETIKQGNKFMVKVWSRIQIEKMIRELRLPSPETRKKLWIGTSPHPKAIYGHDSIGIEAIIEEYAKFKGCSVKLTDEKLALKYGYSDTISIAVIEDQMLTEKGYHYSISSLQRYTNNRINEIADNYTLDQVRIESKEWRVYDDDIKWGVINYIVDKIIKNNTLKNNRELNPDILKNVYILDKSEEKQKQEMILA